MQVIDLVHQHGGDVMRFAGDSIICAFAATKAEHALADGGLAAATSRSVRCASELSFKLGMLFTSSWILLSPGPSMFSSLWSGSKNWS